VSAQEIIAELSKFDRKELERVDAQLHKLLKPAQSQSLPEKRLREVLLHFAGKAQGLPPDYSTNLDHYLYGLPKRRP
jgi:hypothetical protein